MLVLNRYLITLFKIIIEPSTSNSTETSLTLLRSNLFSPQARVKLLPCSESVPEPCLSCGRVDQPERLHTHPAREAAETAGETAKKEAGDRQRHKSPLKVSSEENTSITARDIIF